MGKHFNEFLNYLFVFSLFFERNYLIFSSYTVCIYPFYFDNEISLKNNIFYAQKTRRHLSENRLSNKNILSNKFSEPEKCNINSTLISIFFHIKCYSTLLNKNPAFKKISNFLVHISNSVKIYYKINTFF